MRGKRRSRKTKALLVTLVIILALIILPTGTPEDLVTTLVFIQLLGWKLYLIMAIITLILLLLIVDKRHLKKVFG